MRQKTGQQAQPLRHVQQPGVLFQRKPVHNKVKIIQPPVQRIKQQAVIAQTAVMIHWKHIHTL